MGLADTDVSEPQRKDTFGRIELPDRLHPRWFGRARSAVTVAVRSLLRDYPTWVCGVVLLFLATAYLLPIWSADALAYNGPYYIDLLLILTSILACFQGRSRILAPAARRFWDLMGAAFCCWLLSKLPDVSGPGLAVEVATDLFVMGFFLFALLALTTQPDRGAAPFSRTGRLRVMAAVVAFGGLVMYFTIVPGSADQEEYLSWVPHLMMVVLFDLFLVWATARAIIRTRSSAWFPVYALLGLGWIVWLSTDLLDTAWRTGLWQVDLGTPVDLLWALPYVPVVLAARLGRTTPLAELVPTEADAWEPAARPIFVYAMLLLLLHVVMTETGLLTPDLGRIRAFTVISVGGLLCILAVAHERALRRETRVLIQARDSAVALAERAQMLTELEGVQRLESLGVLAGGVAHDFNNVLQGIMGNVDLLGRRLEAGSRSRRYLDRIGGATDRATELVEQILSYSGQGPTRRACVDLNDIVREVLELVPLPIRNRAQIRTRLAAKPLHVLADPTQLRQVVLNLVMNAYEAVEGEGFVTIATREESAPVPNAGDAARGLSVRTALLEIEDTGIGMDATTQARMFEPFYTTKSSGRGLGLASTWGIVRSHNGTVQVESEVGKGTTMTVTVPVTDAVQTAAPSIAPAIHVDTPRKRGRVLVMDDEPEVIAVVQSALEERGHSVITASHAQAGIRALTEHSDVELTLLDLTMPGMKAPDVMREIRTLRPHLPVVVMTGFDRDKAVPALEEYQPEAFLHKPFRLDDLFSVTDRVLGPRDQTTTARIDPTGSVAEG